MKKLLLTLALLLPTSAWAQCNGVFPNNTLCGNVSGVGALPQPTPNNVLTGVPGGTNGQIEYNNAGNFGGFTPGGDLSFSNPNFTIAPNAVTTTKILDANVTNPKLLAGAANTLKGSLNGTNSIDIAVAACAADGSHALTWSAGVGPVCTSIGPLILGTPAGTAIPVGYKGHIDEITIASGSAVGVPFHVVTSVATLAQPAGIYDCSGEAIATTGTSQIASEYHTTITTTVPPALQGLPASGGGNGAHILYIVNNSAVFNFGPRRFVFAAPTTVYLTMYSTFGTDAGGTNGLGGSIAAYGYLRCETK